jgi:hypothetical protein
VELWSDRQQAASDFFRLINAVVDILIDNE